MLNKFVLALFLLFVGACSSVNSSGYGNELQNWIGQSEYRLYQTWGAPANVVYIAPNKKVITYVKTSAKGSNTPYENQLYYQGMGNNDSLWDKLFGPPAQQQANWYYCNTSFVIQNGVIINYNFNGDNCVA